MNTRLQTQFLDLWNRYFPGAELPLTFRYAAESEGVPVVPAPDGHRCLIAQLARVRRGEDRCFRSGSIGCNGGKRYLGFSDRMFPGFEQFLSHDDSGAGERYKSSPERVAEAMRSLPPLSVRGENLILKRWDRLTENERPDGVVFLAPPDVIAGLFTLANFDSSAADAVIAPFGAGCATIIYHPYKEELEGTGRCVLGLFDPSARKCAASDLLAFSAPFSRFCEMIGNMEASFLTTPAWRKISGRTAMK